MPEITLQDVINEYSQYIGQRVAITTKQGYESTGIVSEIRSAETYPPKKHGLNGPRLVLKKMGEDANEAPFIHILLKHIRTITRVRPSA